MNTQEAIQQLQDRVTDIRDWLMTMPEIEQDGERPYIETEMYLNNALKELAYAKGAYNREFKRLEEVEE